MDWNNVDLNRESDATILDAYTFDTLLLEVNCNLPVINRETVRKQFETSLQNKIRDAREVFEANLNNIVSHAKK